MSMIAALDTSAFRHSSDRAVQAWLVVLCAMVFAMVLLGGATRLTESGLSMVEWKPLTVLPPMGDAAWQAEFDKYRASPEFLHKNTFMTVAEFKGIFWLEYIHRLWGRLIGAAVLVPLLWVAVRGGLDRPLSLRMAGLFVLGGAQGVLGW
jgi:cytochrome c oxidase assembly protein subunit 15